MPPGLRRVAAPSDATLALALLGAGGSFAVALVLWQAGPLPAVAAAALLAVGGILLADARAAVLALVGGVLVFEGTADWGVPAMARMYETIIGPLAPIDFLLVLAVAATGLHVLRADLPPRFPFGFVAPLSILAFAYLVGALNGYLGGEYVRFSLVSQLQSALPLWLVPLLVVNVVRTREELRSAVGWAGGLAVLKAVLGLVVVFGGLGTFEPGIGRLTYYEAPGNLIVVVALMTLLAAGLARIPMPVWLRWALPLLALSLLLSYRRTFWLATIVCTIVVYLVASGRTGRRLIVPGALVVVVAGWLVLSTGLAGGLQGTLVDRAQSLDPKRLAATDADRYRISERRNVVEQITERPLTGQGLGVKWVVRHPLPPDTGYGQQYIHFSIIWQWFRNGVLGVVGYLWLMLAVVAAGVRLWRREPDRRLAAAALGGAAGAIALLVVELASSVVGVEFRGTTIFGAIIGLLSVGLMLPASAQVTPGTADTMRSS